ncbi:MAG: gamma-glutamyl-gamma-aminobutyrate hydrolase family protein [Acidobacteriaceae bacterium]|jgi:putative glutamine amidotransferase
MTSALPRIAIPEPTSTDEAYNQRSLPQYIQAVEAAGGTAVPVPLHESAAAQADILASCSAILLPGSPADVDPARYGQETVKETAARDMPREATDNLLLRDAFEFGKPILGICYGLQFLNVWRRGSLIQHLPGREAANGISINHEPGRDVQEAHSIEVKPGTRLSRIMASTQEGEGSYVNSSHHQAIDRPGQELVVAAVSPDDGVIEALEGAEPTQFVVAVQWHPERSYESSAASRALFAAFLEAARSWSPSAFPALHTSRPGAH